MISVKKFITLPTVIMVFFFIYNLNTRSIEASESTSTKYYVYADSGLRMRSTANINAEMITLIPFGAEVEKIKESKNKETIGGKTASWYMVSYAGKKGWVFGGFLGDIKPLRECTSLTNFPINLGEIYNYDGDRIDPHTGKKFPKFPVPMMDPELDNFTLNADGTGERIFSYYQGSSGKFPIRWKIKEDKIIIEGETSISNEPQGSEPCRRNNPEEVKACQLELEKVKEKFRKKYGADKVTVTLSWEITLTKIGQANVVLKNSIDLPPRSGQGQQSLICTY